MPFKRDFQAKRQMVFPLPPICYRLHIALSGYRPSHKVSGSHNPVTVWPRTSKLYKVIKIDLLYKRTWNEVTSCFQSDANWIAILAKSAEITPLSKGSEFAAEPTCTRDTQWTWFLRLTHSTQFYWPNLKEFSSNTRDAEASMRRYYEILFVTYATLLNAQLKCLVLTNGLCGCSVPKGRHIICIKLSNAAFRLVTPIRKLLVPWWKRCSKLKR